MTISLNIHRLGSIGFLMVFIRFAAYLFDLIIFPRRKYGVLIRIFGSIYNINSYTTFINFTLLPTDAGARWPGKISQNPIRVTRPVSRDNILRVSVYLTENKTRCVCPFIYNYNNSNTMRVRLRDSYNERLPICCAWWNVLINVFPIFRKNYPSV